MAVISTKELFDKYFETKDADTIRKTRAQVDRPEVYIYEEKIGKQLVEMNEEELFEMICTFGNKKSVVSDGIRIGSSSFRKYVSSFRVIFQFYIENFEIIRNPFHNEKFKGIQSEALFADNKNRFTRQQMDDVIEKLHAKYDYEHANYYELIMMLFYDGFSDAREIVELKESQINFRKKEVKLTGRTIKLSDRCFELLLEVHNMEMMYGIRGNYYMLSWRDSYFKFIVRPKESAGFQNKDITAVGRKINFDIAQKIAKEFNIDIGYRKIYLLGFYDYLVSKYGEERVKEMITSKRVQKDIFDFSYAMNAYGIVIDNMVYLKRELVQLRPQKILCNRQSMTV